MRSLIILAIAAVVLALRLWQRRRARRPSGGSTSGGSTSGGPMSRGSTSGGPQEGGAPGGRWRPLRRGQVVSVGTGYVTGRVTDRVTGYVALVAAREVRERFRGRIFRVGTVLILAVVAAAIVIPAIGSGPSRPQRIGVVGVLLARQRAAVVTAGAGLSIAVSFVAEKDVAAARAALRSGKLDLTINDGREVLVDKAIGPSDTSTTAQLVRTVAASLGELGAVTAAHLSAEQAAALAGAKALPVTSLQRGRSKGSSTGTLLIGLILIFVMLSQYNTWILMGVMEEKASRVVEVLLATLRPAQLLAGKVLGIGLVAFAQAGLIVVFALLLAKGVGSDLLQGTAPLALVSTFVWLVLGYAFYSWVYAAAGSMAERQDQIQTLVFPLSLPMIFGYVMGLTAISSANPSTLFEVLAYLPPTAPFAMPVLVGLGAANWLEFLASVAISVASTVLVARLATNIYRRAILRTGRRVRLREVLSSASQ